MSVYYRESGLTWKQYLQADSFVQDITGQVKRSGEGIRMAISDQTRSIVASNDALARTFGAGFDSVNSTLEWGFGRIVSEIAELRAEFSYGMGLVLEQLRIQQRTLEGILDRLDAIHETLKHPLLTQARELSKIGMERTSKGLLQEGLEALLESAEKNKTDFLVQLQIGKLYLYGRNATDDVISLPKAEEHLRLSARYANSEISHLPDAAKYCAEAFLHAAISCYAQANEKWLAKDVDAAGRFTEQALELSKQATQVYPQLAEAFYHHSKCAALLGNGKTATAYLKVAILADRNYCIKADADRDFDGVRPEIHRLFESLRQCAKAEAAKALESVKKLLEDWVFQTTEAKKAEAEIRNLVNGAETLFRQDTYFGYLDALTLLKKAQQTFADIPPYGEFQTLIGHTGYVTAAAFSPDGRYLASASMDKTVRIWEISSFRQIQTLTGHTSSVSAVAFSPDGRYLASGGSDNIVCVWEVDNFREIQELTGHTSGVSAVAFSPDGRYLATGGYDNTVCVFEVDSFRQIQELRGHTDAVKSVAFSPNGKYLASGSDDRTIRVWGPSIIPRRELERIETEKEQERQARELREYRLKNGLCLACYARAIQPCFELLEEEAWRRN